MPLPPTTPLHLPLADRGLVDLSPGNRHTGRLRTVIGFALAAYALLVATNLTFRPGNPLVRTAEAATVAALVAAFAVFPRRPLQAAALGIATIWGEAAFSFAINGSLRSTSLLVFPVTIAVAGLLFGSRWAVRTAVTTGLYVPLVAIGHSLALGARPLLHFEQAHWLLVHELLIFLTALITCGVVRGYQGVLAESEAMRQRYLELFDEFPDLILFHARDTGEILAGNETAARALGLPRAEMIGRSLYEFLDVESAPRVRRHLETLPALGSVANLEVRVHRRPAGFADLLLTASTVPEPGRAAAVVRSVLRDVTAHRAAETALRQSDERFRLAMEAVSDGLWDWDITTDQGYFSPGYFRMLGYEPGEFVMTGRKWSELIHPEDRERAVAANRDCIENRRPVVEVEFRMRAKDGSWRWILGRGTAVQRDAQGRALRMIGTHLDITGRRQAEIDRLVLGKLESTGVLAGGIAHDFNNLLTIVLLGLECVRTELPSSDNARASLADIEEAALTARDLAAQLMAFARGGEPTLRPCRLEPLLRQAATFALSGSPVSARVIAPPELWSVVADPDQITQVFRHLILNAREAMPAGGVVTVTATNWVHDGRGAPTLPAGDYLRIQVSDTGVGLTPEVREKVFDPYFSTKQRGTQKGMGLGLTVCHAVVQRHGGTIQVSSDPGRGSTFTVCLRADRDTAPAPVVPPAAPPAAPTDLPRRRILVMDDERLLRQLLLIALQRSGHEVTVAAEGQEAVDLFLQARRDGRPYDLVLLDLTVRNGLGGVETLRLLRQHDPAVRAVAMSGHTEDDAIRDYTRFGFAAALGKPFTAETLRAALRRSAGG